MNCKQYFARGFTLAEIIISLLLLSVFAVGTFKSAHFAQHSANRTLQRFLETTQEKQHFSIQRLGQTYTSIQVDPEFQYLHCLIDRALASNVGQDIDCNRVFVGER